MIIKPYVASLTVSAIILGLLVSLLSWDTSGSLNSVLAGIMLATMAVLIEPVMPSLTTKRWLALIAIAIVLVVIL